MGQKTDKVDYSIYVCNHQWVPSDDELGQSRRAAEPFADDDRFPDWFVDFLADRQTRKPSAHTVLAYRRDFNAIAGLITDGVPAGMVITDITRDSMRRAFSTFARDHAATSIQRCWSTWNVLCTYLYTAELLAANPMTLVGRPKVARPLPKALSRTAVAALLDAVALDADSTHRTVWAERDLAIILTSLLGGLRASELCQLNIGDIRTTDTGAAVIMVRGNGGKERSVPIERELLSVIDSYLETRAGRCPNGARLRSDAPSPLSRWPARAPLFVGTDGDRITRSTLESRIRRAFKRAGPDAQPVAGALVHGFRHTYATELANADVSVYTLMKLLGHESMTTSQRYVAAAGAETRSAAARNPLYAMVPR